jgi:hypothetical protein
MHERDRIDRFLSAGPWAVAGASTDRAKYGNKVLRCYLQAGKTPVHPLNPTARTVEGLPAFSRAKACSSIRRARGFVLTINGACASSGKLTYGCFASSVSITAWSAQTVRTWGRCATC